MRTALCPTLRIATGLRFTARPNVVEYQVPGVGIFSAEETPDWSYSRQCAIVGVRDVKFLLMSKQANLLFTSIEKALLP